MAKKVVIDPVDFDKIAAFITMRPVAFNDAAKAAEIAEIFKRVQVMEIEIKKSEK
jgi:hypothetical protein